jgi:RNA polymerase sigma factor (sigma-70 family)
MHLAAEDCDPPSADPPVDAQVEHTEQATLLRRMLDDLPLRQREAVVLRYFEDLSVEQTAAAMGCAEGTVKATVHQALLALQHRFHAR